MPATPPMPAEPVLLRAVSGPEPPEDDAKPQLPTPWPAKPDWRSWHGWAYLFLGLGLPVLVYLASVGAVAMYQASEAQASAVASTSATHKPAAKPRHTAPVVDVPGYRAAIGGRGQAAFATALKALQADVQAYNYPQGRADAQRLERAARAWLRQLRAPLKRVAG